MRTDRKLWDERQGAEQAAYENLDPDKHAPLDYYKKMIGWEQFDKLLHK